MNGRQRLLAALNGQPADRIPITEIGIWPETEERWHSEGLPQDVSAQDHFGLDRFHFFSFDGSLMLPPETKEETEDILVVSDGDGNTYRYLKNRQAAPQLVGTTVNGWEAWERLRIRLSPDYERFSSFRRDVIWGTLRKDSQEQYYERVRQADGFTVLVPIEPCWYYIRLLGEEEALVQMALEPQFAQRIMEDYTEFNIRMLEEITKHGYSFDAMWVFSDLCYKNGMLFSPEFYRNYVLPCQKKLFAAAKEHGMKVIYHSDGDIRALLPLLIEAGIDCMQPLEARAGNDICEYVEQYGDRLTFIGNINADILAGAVEDIERELLKKIPAAKKYRRYIYHSDHSVPDTVSLENFKYAIMLAKKLGQY